MQHKEITENLGEFQKFLEDVNKIGAVRLQQTPGNTNFNLPHTSGIASRSYGQEQIFNYSPNNLPLRIL